MFYHFKFFTTMELTLFDFNDVSPQLALCFNEGCPRKEECMRYVVGRQVPDRKTSGMAVYPNALHGGACEYFYQLRLVRAARGFGNIFADVKQKHVAEMRQQMEHYLGGHGTYYRYKRGERLLMPEQQEWICRLFEKYGYDRNVVFSDYQQVYDLG